VRQAIEATGDPYSVWRSAVRCNSPGDKPASVGLQEAGAWQTGVTRQAISVALGIMFVG